MDACRQQRPRKWSSQRSSSLRQQRSQIRRAGSCLRKAMLLSCAVQCNPCPQPKCSRGGGWYNDGLMSSLQTLLPGIAGYLLREVGRHKTMIQEVMPSACKQYVCHAGDDDTVTFSFGTLVDKIKNNLSPQAFSGNGSRSRAGSSAGLAARPGAAQLPRGSLSPAGEGSSMQRSRSRMQAVPKGEPHLQDSIYSRASSKHGARNSACTHK